mmetsp:Transcript_43618/g.72636  ORF Transcript_43618/g.72636 Transcript_43618/m.72636 type:complete len:753 (+) Transcript_43618:451-2709(+)
MGEMLQERGPQAESSLLRETSVRSFQPQHHDIVAKDKVDGEGNGVVVVVQYAVTSEKGKGGSNGPPPKRSMTMTMRVETDDACANPFQSGDESISTHEIKGMSDEHFGDARRGSQLAIADNAFANPFQSGDGIVTSHEIKGTRDEDFEATRRLEVGIVGDAFANPFQSGDGVVESGEIRGTHDEHFGAARRQSLVVIADDAFANPFQSGDEIVATCEIKGMSDEHFGAARRGSQVVIAEDAFANPFQSGDGIVAEHEIRGTCDEHFGAERRQRSEVEISEDAFANPFQTGGEMIVTKEILGAEADHFDDAMTVDVVTNAMAEEDESAVKSGRSVRDYVSTDRSAFSKGSSTKVEVQNGMLNGHDVPSTGKVSIKHCNRTSSDPRDGDRDNDFHTANRTSALPHDVSGEDKGLCAAPDIFHHHTTPMEKEGQVLNNQSPSSQDLVADSRTSHHNTSLTSFAPDGSLPSIFVSAEGASCEISQAHHHPRSQSPTTSVKDGDSSARSVCVCGVCVWCVRSPSEQQQLQAQADQTDTYLSQEFENYSSADEDEEEPQEQQVEEKGGQGLRESQLKSIAASQQGQNTSTLNLAPSLLPSQSNVSLRMDVEEETIIAAPGFRAEETNKNALVLVLPSLLPSQSNVSLRMDVEEEAMNAASGFRAEESNKNTLALVPQSLIPSQSNVLLRMDIEEEVVVVNNEPVNGLGLVLNRSHIDLGLTLDNLDQHFEQSTESTLSDKGAGVVGPSFAKGNVALAS